MEYDFSDILNTDFSRYSRDMKKLNKKADKIIKYNKEHGGDSGFKPLYLDSEMPRGAGIGRKRYDKERKKLNNDKDRLKLYNDIIDKETLINKKDLDNNLVGKLLKDRTLKSKYENSEVMAYSDLMEYIDNNKNKRGKKNTAQELSEAINGSDSSNPMYKYYNYGKGEDSFDELKKFNFNRESINGDHNLDDNEKEKLNNALDKIEGKMRVGIEYYDGGKLKSKAQKIKDQIKLRETAIKNYTYGDKGELYRYDSKGNQVKAFRGGRWNPLNWFGSHSYHFSEKELDLLYNFSGDFSQSDTKYDYLRVVFFDEV